MKIKKKRFYHIKKLEKYGEVKNMRVRQDKHERKAIQGRIAQQQKNKEVKPAMKMLNKQISIWKMNLNK